MTETFSEHEPDGGDALPTSDCWCTRAGAVYFPGAGDPLVAVEIGVPVASTIQEDANVQAARRRDDRLEHTVGRCNRDFPAMCFLHNLADDPSVWNAYLGI